VQKTAYYLHENGLVEGSLFLIQLATTIAAATHPLSLVATEARSRHKVVLLAWMAAARPFFVTRSRRRRMRA
jgi:hypothetical protein